MTDDVPGTFWKAADGLHIDTRGLQPPDPMVAILWHLEKPGQTEQVTVYLDRDPIYLFAELAERGWSYEYMKSTESFFCLILRPKT